MARTARTKANVRAIGPARRTRVIDDLPAGLSVVAGRSNAEASPVVAGAAVVAGADRSSVTPRVSTTARRITGRSSTPCVRGRDRLSSGTAPSVAATHAANAYDLPTIPERARGGRAPLRLEAPLARAKRTDRAAARRRYRAQSDVAAEPLDDDASDARPPSSTPSASGRPVAGRPSRPGIFSAFRASFRPIDVRGDLRALPWLLRTPAFFAPVILSGLAVALVPLTGANPLAGTLYQYFSYTAPLGTAFVAGFFAPRASYLLGMLAALASVAFQAIAFNAGTFGGTLAGAVDASGNPVAPRILPTGS